MENLKCNLKCYLLELWNYALLMYRTSLIRAESKRRKAIGGSERKRASVSSSDHQSRSGCGGNHKIEGDVTSEDDPAVGTSSKKCLCDRLEMRRVFDLIDENKDGLISVKELQRYMKRLGFDLSDQSVGKIVRAVDRNSDDCVDFEEFFLMYSPLSGDGGESKSHDNSSVDDEEEDAVLLKAFFVFDENKDGFISRLELQQVLLKLGLPEGRSLKGCQMMIEKVDVDGNGKVDFFEFKRMMRSNSFVF